MELNTKFRRAPFGFGRLYPNIDLEKLWKKHEHFKNTTLH